LVPWLLKLGQYDDGFLVAITTDKRPCYNRTFHTSNQLDCSIRVGLWWLYGAYHRFTHYICSHRVSLTSSQRVEGFSSTRGYCLLSYKTTAFVPCFMLPCHEILWQCGKIVQNKPIAYKLDIHSWALDADGWISKEGISYPSLVGSSATNDAIIEAILHR